MSSYTFNWSNGVTDSINNYLAVGKYLITITDSKGCKEMDSIVIGSTDIGQFTFNEKLSIITVYPNPLSGSRQIKIDRNYDIPSRINSINNVVKLYNLCFKCE